jgi:hypothetical protein
VAKIIIDPQRMNKTLGVKSVRRLKRAMKFRGTLNRLNMVALLFLVRIIHFIVPMEGKYTSMHISNRFITRKVVVVPPE